MLITKITMNGFKNSIETVEYNLTKKTIVSGDNGTGKTSIGEAIVWCLLGTDLTGNEKATTRLLNNDSKNVMVEMDFTLEGETYTLVRNRKANKTDIYLNDSIIKSQDLIKFYQDKEIFLSVFNPSYFPSLAPKDAKELLNKVLKQVSNEEVFNQMSEYERDLLLNNKFKTSNLFLENKRDQLKEIEKDILFAEGFIAAKNDGMNIPTEMIFDSTELNKLQQSKTDIFNKISSLKNVDKGTLLEVESLVKERELYRREYISTSKELEGLNNTIVCPNCSTKIDIDSSTKDRLHKSLVDLETKGKKLSKTIAKNEDENRKIIQKYNEEIAENNKVIEFFQIKLEEINNSIITLESSKREVELNNSNRVNMLRMYEDNKVKIAKAEEDITKCSNSKKDLNNQIDAAKTFNSIKLKTQSNSINLYLIDVEIQLEKITKDGELKDDFRILYKGREFAVLSNSERIKAGLEISNLIMSQIDLELPIFIDNAESITTYIAPNTQIIEARVVKGQALEVNPEEE